MGIEALDILYLPSTDVAADVAYYRDVLGASVVFAIDAMGTRVAEVSLADGPRLVLAGHLAGRSPVLLHRVDDLDAALAELALTPEARVELPMGPCALVHTPGGQRLGFYERTRPEVESGFSGRADF